MVRAVNARKAKSGLIARSMRDDEAVVAVTDEDLTDILVMVCQCANRRAEIVQQYEQ